MDFGLTRVLVNVSVNVEEDRQQLYTRPLELGGGLPGCGDRWFEIVSGLCVYFTDDLATWVT